MSAVTTDGAVESRSVNLDVLVDRVPVTLGGVVYEMRDREDLGMAEDEELRRIMIRWHDLRTSASDSDAPLSDDDAREYDEIEMRLCRLALIAPREIVATLNARQRNGVIEAFFNRPGVIQLSRRALVRLLQAESQATPNSESVETSSDTTDTKPSEPTKISSKRTRKSSRDSNTTITAPE